MTYPTMNHSFWHRCPFWIILRAIKCKFTNSTPVCPPSRIQMLLYPHLLYPGQWICLTGTEFMVVAIAFER